jgi:hypothetical protein
MATQQIVSSVVPQQKFPQVVSAPLKTRQVTRPEIIETAWRRA